MLVQHRSLQIQFDCSSLLSTTKICHPLASCAHLHTLVHIVGSSAHDSTGALFTHLRHVLLQKSIVLVAALLRCSCGRLWSPFLCLILLALVYMLDAMLMAMSVWHAHDHMICKFLPLLIPLILYLCWVVYRTLHAYPIGCQHSIWLMLQWLVKICHQIRWHFR